MTKENIIDLDTFRAEERTPNLGFSISEELQSAIQDLIYRLRELGPLQTTN